MSLLTSAFALHDRLAAKSDPALITTDEQFFRHLAATLEQTVADLEDRLDEARKAPAGTGQRALDRDQEVHRLTTRLRTLRRFGIDLCLGRMVPAAATSAAGSGAGSGAVPGEDGAAPVYVGRLGLTDPSGRRLLIDWRSPAAEPFFAATHARPTGLASRRRYRWTPGKTNSGARITDYWDEVFTPDGLVGHAALDDQSAFIATLSESRSPRMRDVLGTIQADQDAIIRAGSRGTLVVDGGPGTGKTVVALHRAAYLLYSDPRLGHHRGDVLVVGPHQPYLAYVGDVLPSLGEEGVQTCTLRDLVPEGASAAPERDPEVARLKSSAALVAAIEPAVLLYEEPPKTGTAVETPWGEFWLGAEDWAEAFGAVEPGTPHNEAPEQILDALGGILVDRLESDVAVDDVAVDDDGIPAERPADDQVRRAVERDREVRATLRRSWPPLEPTDLVGDLWSVPAYLHRCAPHLSADEVRTLRRDDAQAWTLSDLPLLDAARLRLGDPEAARVRRRRRAALANERKRMNAVVDDLIATDDSEMLVMSMLRGEDLRRALDDDTALPRAGADPLAGPFAHIVVDEAQELTDAEWQMLLRRCPSRSFTVVGDRAQARRGFTESWRDRLERAGLDRVGVATLTVNYRTPAEVMAEAEPVIRAVLPDANVPTSIRSGGVPVVHGSIRQLATILDDWLSDHAEGTACVIGDPAFRPPVRLADRVRFLTPQLSKGLEFDLVVLVDPGAFGDGVGGAVDRYVAMTRATRQLVVLTSG